MSNAFISTTNFKFSLDQKALMRELNSSQAMALEIRKYIAPQLDQAQKELVNDFESHQVTSEIRDGPLASNSSGTLSGRGNLFSFIGFDSSDNPTNVISKIFNKKISFTVNKSNDLGGYKITFMIPTVEEVFQNTPIPWASGQSWAEGIEKGISNLGSYIYKSNGDKKSRSGSGLQSKNVISSVTFKTTPYISEIIQKFKRNLNELTV